MTYDLAACFFFCCCFFGFFTNVMCYICLLWTIHINTRSARIA